MELLGNVTRDPELRYTQAGSAVCNFSIATNRSWKTETGETKEEAEFHRIIVWDKRAELVSKYVTKGSKLYVSGRLHTRKWENKEKVEAYTTEIIADDLIFLDDKVKEEIIDPANG